MTPRFQPLVGTARQLCRLLFILLCLAATNALQAENTPTLELVEVGFYEGGTDTNPPEWGSPELADSFDRGQVRYIYTMLNLKNLLWQKQGQDVRLEVRYLRPDGSLFGNPVIEYHVPADWEYTDLWTGWGWDVAEQWNPGTYTVEVWRDDVELLARRDFAITAGARASVPPPVGTVSFEKMAFFEDGEDNSNPPDDWGDARLRNRFASKDTRYIYTMISLKNLQWQHRDQDIVIHLRYYRSDGTLYGNPIIDYRVPAAWEHAELWNGWGWSSPGRWKPDRYRVELWLDNRRKIGEQHFEIY